LAEAALVDLIPAEDELLETKAERPEKKRGEGETRRRRIPHRNGRAMGLGGKPSVIWLSNGGGGKTWNQCIARRANPVFTAALEIWCNTADRLSELLASGFHFVKTGRKTIPSEEDVR
jgi:hypothetical protein